VHHPTPADGKLRAALHLPPTEIVKSTDISDDIITTATLLIIYGEVRLVGFEPRNSETNSLLAIKPLIFVLFSSLVFCGIVDICAQT